MATYYDFSISSKKYKDGTDCYVFGVKIKPEYTVKKKGKTVIKTLETYFEKSNLNHRSIYEKIKKVDFSYLSNIKNELIPHEKRLKIIKIIEQDE